MFRQRAILYRREETLDPAVDGAAVDDEAALGKPLDNVGIAQAVADVPAHAQRDHVVRKGM